MVKILLFQFVVYESKKPHIILSSDWLEVEQVLLEKEMIENLFCRSRTKNHFIMS